MSRASFAILLAVLALFVFVYLPRGGEGRAEERVVYWKQKIETEVPVGSSKNNLLEWAKENSIEFSPADNGRMVAKAEWISGFGSPTLFCSEWHVMIDAAVNPFDDIVEERVYKTNACS